MTEENKLTPTEQSEMLAADQKLQSRREFLISLGKWSKVVIGAVILGSGLIPVERDAQAGSWINRRGGWGGGWVNGGGGGWYNRGGWANGGGSWINGGGGSWVNRRGGWGGSWINR